VLGEHAHLATQGIETADVLVEAGLPYAEARWITETVKGPARFVIVDDAGHYPHSQQPDVVNAELVEFLRA